MKKSLFIFSEPSARGSHQMPPCGIKAPPASALPKASSRLAWLTFGIPILVLLLISCKSQQPITTAQQSNLLTTHNQSHRDSVVIRDSIFIRMQGDTVFCDRWHDRWQVQRVEKTDTLYRDREVITELPPERYIPTWAWWCLGICIALMILLIIRIILRFFAFGKLR